MPPVGVAEFAFRVIVSLFFAAAFGFVCWAIGRIVMLSLVMPTPTTAQVMAIIAIGLGAGVGASSGSLMLHLKPTRMAGRVLLCVALAMLGGFLGLLWGRNVYIMAGMPGIPELRGIVMGAVGMSVLTPVALDLADIVKRRRGRRDADVRRIPPPIRRTEPRGRGNGNRV